jgi:hypothetical protein
MFGGFPLAALHWINPGTDPIAYLLQLFPRERVYQALGYVSITLVLAACTSAYFYIRDLTGARDGGDSSILLRSFGLRDTRNCPSR